MLYLRVAAAALALSMLGVVSAQDKDKDKKDEPPAKTKGQLPPYFKQLNLSPDQVAKVQKVRADFKAKQADLKRQGEKLKADEKDALSKLLTDEQRKKLRELQTGEKSGDK